MKRKVKAISELSLLRRLAVKTLHKLQKLSMRIGLNNLSLSLAKLHFKTYFGKNLVNEVLIGTEEGKSATRRYGRMVVRMFFKDKARNVKLMFYKAAQEKFEKDLLLEVEL